jgi:hypothetical protein
MSKCTRTGRQVVESHSGRAYLRMGFGRGIRARQRSGMRGPGRRLGRTLGAEMAAGPELARVDGAAAGCMAEDAVTTDA